MKEATLSHGSAKLLFPAVLWKGGISFGGVVSFIFADLIVLPILDTYRKYYGWKVIGYILLMFYATMAVARCIVEFLFNVLSIIPQNRTVAVITEGYGGTTRVF